MAPTVSAAMAPSQKKKGKKEVARGDLARASVVCSSELAGARAATGEERRAEELGLLEDLGGDGGWTGGENKEKCGG